MADDTDPGLLPIPWHVKLYAALLTNLRAAALLFGLPFGVVVFVASSVGLYPGPGVLPPVAHGVMGWLAGAVSVYFVLGRPY